jgi:hypothetical protein
VNGSDVGAACLGTGCRIYRGQRLKIGRRKEMDSGGKSLGFPFLTPFYTLMNFVDHIISILLFWFDQKS